MSQIASHIERTKRFDLRTLYETSQLLSASLELDFVLNNLLLTAMSKLLVTRGAVWLFEPISNEYRLVATKGPAGLVAGAAFPADALKVDGLMLKDALPKAMRNNKIELAAPLGFGGRRIGVIGLGRKATGADFKDDEVEFVKSLVNMSSAAVHNSLIVEELRQANRDLDGKIQQLDTLFDISQEFNATVDLERLVKLLSFALMGQMLVNRHLFILRRTTTVSSDGGNASDHEYRVASIKGFDPEDIEGPFVDRVCRLSSVLLSNGEDEDDNAFLARYGLALILPIRHQNETCGVLCLGPKMTGQPYQPDDVDFLYALGNLAFVSIQNSFLVDEQIEKERLEEEMRLAREIQERLQPQTLPEVDGLDIAFMAIPSRHVAGDYVDMFKVGGDRFLVAIGDVTGKGVPASLLMSNLQACLHVMRPMEVSLEVATDHINRVISDNTAFDRFITFFHGIFSDSGRTLEYVNAGHNPPMLVRADGTVELLDKGGLLLGVMKDMPYEKGTVDLNAGDVLVLFTDGVTEAMSPEEEEYEEKRLEPVLVANRACSAQAIIDAVREDVRRFTHDVAVLDDDLTMLVVKVL